MWPSLWFILVAGSGLFCGWALLWLTRIPPLPDCEQITPFHSARDMLYCARSQARTGDPNSLVQSVLLTVNWPKADASYDESQEILKELLGANFGVGQSLGAGRQDRRCGAASRRNSP